MDPYRFALVVTVAFSVVGVVGDYFLKRASETERVHASPWFYLGFVLYASTAFGWVFVMKYLKLATIGVVYSVCVILLLTIVGLTQFDEKLDTMEWLGVGCAIASLVLLSRFAS